jgi:hypothetical protein
MPIPNSKCVILVPVGTSVLPGCEDGLRELERRGYPVRRVHGYSAIDAARNQMATDAIQDEFEELFWIDSDITFNPDDVDRLRSHDKPVAAGIYSKKGPREFACHFLPGTKEVKFGSHGGVMEVRFVGWGFVSTKKQVYLQLQRQFDLPICNERFGKKLIPFFGPMVIDDGKGNWYLAEDYAFCERARQCGIPIHADTSIRLWHIGNYGYSWEDAGSGKERFKDYTFHIHSESS